MSAEWQTLPLEECMESIIDYRGKTPNKTSYGIPLVTAKIVKDGRIAKPTEFIAPEDYDSWMRRGLPKVGDILLTTEAPLGEVAQLKERNVALAQRLITLRGKKGVLHNDFLKYLMLSSNVQAQLSARATGTTVTGIKQKELRKVLLSFPAWDEQVSIAGVLSSLDDKIELNRKMNETLEEMARAIFKSWFIDFDPVIDNALRAGNPIPESMRERAEQRKRRLDQNQPSPPAPLPEVGGGGKKEHYRGGFDFSGLVEIARNFRRNQTPAEDMFWAIVRNHQFMDLKFRRQHQIGEYVADFYCDEHRLVIELDGGVHAQQKAKDGKRDAWMKTQGFTVLRFKNKELLDDPERVLADIQKDISSSPFGGDGGEGLTDAIEQKDISSSPFGRGGGEGLPDATQQKDISSSPFGRGGGEGLPDATQQKNISSSPFGRGGGEGLPDATRQLFPDSFTPSPLGPIPKGWEVGTLGDIAENIKEQIKPEEIDPTTAYIGLEHMPKKSISLSEWGEVGSVTSNKFRFEKDHILFGKLRSYFHKVGVAPLGGVCSTDILVIAPKNDYKFGQVLAIVSSDDFVAHTDAASTGTRMPRTNWKDMSRYEVALPSTEIAETFSSTVRTIANKMVANIHESKTLANLRDTLLPKLLSGELSTVLEKKQ